ncbi:hypothetical protein SLEP1_g29498 [Rubroshorea leprosula]|uniref:Uncharacterized protein n=1 Tax=Rubroshorea leprosula TaxID=152421 RepID=A0AAV5JX37_9ROSI|nr:hypothetical protein SLEP1_g29498 [Rubroshorea leprosula]
MDECHLLADKEAAPKINIAENVISFQKNHEKEKGNTSLRHTQMVQNESCFWEGFMIESGSEKEWMGRNLRRPSKLRKKKSRSCASVYRKERKETRQTNLEGGTKRAKEREGEKEMPKFQPGSQIQVAGESVNDSCIENRNGILKRAQEACNIEKIWAFAKEIGAGDYGNEHEVMRRLKDMEERDKELFRKSKVSADVVAGIDGVNLK